MLAAARNESRKSLQPIGGGFGAFAPNSIVNEMTLRWILAMPENGGPQMCRSAPALTEIVTVASHRSIVARTPKLTPIRAS